MSDKIQEILTVVGRIETKLDTQAASFAAHVRDDALMAHDVHLIMKKQRGFVHTGLAALGAGIAAAGAWALHKVIGN